jgi:hypothetical protein
MLRLHKFAKYTRSKTNPLIIPWQPRANHPQSTAYYSEASEIFFGGKAGSGKSDLLLGLASIEHEKSIIFRREYPQLKGLIARSQEIIKDRNRYNKSEKTWDLGEGKFLEFASCQYEDDVEKYQGRPHDFIGIDELTHFSKKQYTFLCGWNRTTVPGQRCRIVATGNPPTSSEGRWVIEHFAPWLDPRYSQRTGRASALYGELRYFATGKDGVEREFETSEPVYVLGERLDPKSRTYIPGEMLEELVKTGYRARLQSLPEPLRSILLEGNFQTSLEENPWQVIPTTWVELAVSRWNRLAPVAQTHLGVDVSRGGQDETIIVKRHGNWVAPLIAIPGASVTDGHIVAEQVMINLAQSSVSVRIDVVGIGASPYDILVSKGINVIGLNGGAKSNRTDATGQLSFKNKRCEWWWNLRELLDPSNDGAIALPDDPKLFADLIAPRWKIVSSAELGQIHVESKDELRKVLRLGRSTDYADALAYAFADCRGDNAFEYS